MRDTAVRTGTWPVRKGTHEVLKWAGREAAGTTARIETGAQPWVSPPDSRWRVRTCDGPSAAAESPQVGEILGPVEVPREAAAARLTRQLAAGDHAGAETLRERQRGPISGLEGRT